MTWRAVARAFEAEMLFPLQDFEAKAKYLVRASIKALFAVRRRRTIWRSNLRHASVSARVFTTC
jgi:hypothetical protein